MFGPLSFKTAESKTDELFYSGLLEEMTDCMLCDKSFKLPTEKYLLVEHLQESHNLIILDIHKIASLPRYINYWRERLKTGTSLEEFRAKSNSSDSKWPCNRVNTDGTESGHCFIFSEELDEDRELRENLQASRLEFVLEKQRQEREVKSYCRECLFCHTLVQGTVVDYVTHISGKHNLQLGKPQNLVFVDELVNVIDKKMENLQCLYCERIFKDRNVLKEHMRKKLHKRINPKNTEYDKFYIVNYLEMGKNWKTLEKASGKKDGSPEESGSEDSDWSDWTEDEFPSIICLFCKRNFVSWEETLEHMKCEHTFDYRKCTGKLNFYQQVKLVNYIRRQVHRSHCICCDKSVAVESEGGLLGHMTAEQHLKLPAQPLWDQPEYFFPTYENDLFLSRIEDPHEESEASSGVDVWCEDDLPVSVPTTVASC